MCRHCERLVEDVQHKQLLHDFMAVTAEGVNRKLREDKFPLLRPVTADDIDIKIELTAMQQPNISNGLFLHPSVHRLVYRDLTDAME